MIKLDFTYNSFLIIELSRVGKSRSFKWAELIYSELKGLKINLIGTWGLLFLLF